MDYSSAKNKLKEKGFSLISKKDKLYTFTSKFKREDVKISITTQLGGYILHAELNDEKTKMTLNNLEILLILKIL